MISLDITVKIYLFCLPFFQINGQECVWSLMITCFTILRFAITGNQSKVMSTVLMSCNLKPLTWFGYDIIHAHLARFGYGKYLSKHFWYATTAYQASLIFWLDYILSKYKTWLYLTWLSKGITSSTSFHNFSCIFVINVLLLVFVCSLWVINCE